MLIVVCPVLTACPALGQEHVRSRRVRVLSLVAAGCEMRRWRQAQGGFTADFGGRIVMVFALCRRAAAVTVRSGFLSTEYPDDVVATVWIWGQMHTQGFLIDGFGLDRFLIV